MSLSALPVYGYHGDNIHEDSLSTSSVTSLLSPSPLQDLAAPGGDREDGQSLRHHHHTLHRRGPASQRGETIHLLMNNAHRHARTCTETHRTKLSVNVCSSADGIPSEFCMQHLTTAFPPAIFCFCIVKHPTRTRDITRDNFFSVLTMNADVCEKNLRYKSESADKQSADRRSLSLIA